MQVIFVVKAILKMMALKIIYYFRQCRNTFKRYDSGDHISSWKSKELSDQKIKAPATSNNSLSLIYIGTKIRVKFEG